MTSANQPHYEDSPPVTVQSAPPMPTAASAQYCSSSHNALRTLGFALLAAGTVSALAAIACYMYLNRGVYNPADAILLLVEGVAALACVPLLAAGVVTSVVARKKRDKIRTAGARIGVGPPPVATRQPPRQRGRQ